MLSVLARVPLLASVPLDLLNLVVMYNRGFEGRRIGSIPVLCTGFMAVSPNTGALFMADPTRNTVTAYSSGGDLLVTCDGPGFVDVHEVVISATGYVLVSERSTSRIQLFEETSGSWVNTWMVWEDPASSTRYRHYMALTRDNRLVVADRACVRVHTIDGALVHRWTPDFRANVGGVTVLDDNRIAILGSMPEAVIYLQSLDSEVSHDWIRTQDTTHVLAVGTEILDVRPFANRVVIWNKTGTDKRRTFKAPFRRRPYVTAKNVVIAFDALLHRVLVAAVGNMVKVYV